MITYFVCMEMSDEVNCLAFADNKLDTVCIIPEDKYGRNTTMQVHHRQI